MIYFRLLKTSWDYETNEKTTTPAFDDKNVRSTGELTEEDLKKLSIFSFFGDVNDIAEKMAEEMIASLNQGREKVKIFDSLGEEVGEAYPFQLTMDDEEFDYLIQFWDGDDYRNVCGFKIHTINCPKDLGNMYYRSFIIKSNDEHNKFFLEIEKETVKTVKSLKKAFHFIDNFYLNFKWKKSKNVTAPEEKFLVLKNAEEAKILLDGLLLIAEAHRQMAENYKKEIKNDNELLSSWVEEKEKLVGQAYELYDRVKGLGIVS